MRGAHMAHTQACIYRHRNADCGLTVKALAADGCGRTAPCDTQVACGCVRSSTPHSAAHATIPRRRRRQRAKHVWPSSWRWRGRGGTARRLRVPDLIRPSNFMPSRPAPSPPYRGPSASPPSKRMLTAVAFGRRRRRGHSGGGSERSVGRAQRARSQLRAATLVRHDYR